MTDTSIASLLTIQDVMDALQCSRSKVYALVRQGDLKIVKLDRSTRITPGSYNRLMQKITRDDEVA